MIVIILAISVGPGEMLHYVAFHLGFHCCLPVSRMEMVECNDCKFCHEENNATKISEGYYYILVVQE